MDNLPAEEEEGQKTERRKRFMDQFLDDDFMDEEEEPTAPPVRVQPAPRPARVVTQSSDHLQTGLNYQLPKFKSTLPERVKRPSIASVPRQIEEMESLVEEEETSAYLEDFSLRKAVVYSIILEPKYQA